MILHHFNPGFHKIFFLLVCCGFKALFFRLDGGGGDLQPIRTEEPHNWWSPFVTAFISLIMAGGGATNMHMCAIIVLLFLWTGLWRGIECVMKERKRGVREEGAGGCYLICVQAQFSTCRCNKTKSVEGGAYGNKISINVFFVFNAFFPIPICFISSNSNSLYISLFSEISLRPISPPPSPLSLLYLLTFFVLYINACSNAIDTWRHSGVCTHYFSSLVCCAWRVGGVGVQMDFPAVVCIGRGWFPFACLSICLTPTLFVSLSCSLPFFVALFLPLSVFLLFSLSHLFCSSSFFFLCLLSPHLLCLNPCTPWRRHLLLPVPHSS